jgi:rhodanese-related sulfurtransferase
MNRRTHDEGLTGFQPSAAAPPQCGQIPRASSTPQQWKDARMRRLVLCLAVIGLAFVVGAAAAPKGATPAGASAQGQVDFAGFQELTGEVSVYRAKRLVSLSQFQAMAREGNTIILDARSAAAFTQGHIAGAINLPLPDFTAEALRRVIPDPSTRILIYCNNNFENNAAPVVLKRVELALNIQTFINLYGYGYKNVYELGDVVNFNDPAVRWVRGG